MKSNKKKLAKASTFALAVVLSFTMVTDTFASTARTAVNQGYAHFVGGDFGLLGDVNAQATESFEADIVIIGGGAAGLVAALEAHDLGVENIVVLEKAAFTGGNALGAWGGMAAAGTRYQSQFVDHVQNMIDAGLAAGRDFNNPELVRVMAENSAEALHWMNDRAGANLRVEANRMHSTPNTIAGYANLGADIIGALNNSVAEAGVPVSLNTRATNILVNEAGDVTGVRAVRGDNIIDFHASAVILATGGFGASREMIDAHSPDHFAHLALRSHPGTIGGGLVMAHDIGADIIDMNFMTVTDTMCPTTLTTFGPAPRTSGAILVNRQGERFLNELAGGEPLAFGIADQENRRAHFIFDDAAWARSRTIFNNFEAAGIVRSAGSLAELAGLIGVDAGALAETVERYNSFVEDGTDGDFGRPTMFTLEGPNFHAIVTTSGVAGTSGGVVINTDTQVLRPDGTIIRGLFAAGEVTGGVMGYSRAGGHSLADTTVFGRIAAERALEFLNANGGLTRRVSDFGITAPLEAVPQVQGNFEDGVFYGSANGHKGEISVRVTVEGGNIVDIEVVSHRETFGFFDGARDTVLTQVIRNQSVQNQDIDAVSGATVSRIALIMAISNALS